MNKQEIAEIRRRFNPDKNCIPCVRGCYVNDKREIVSQFNRSFVSIPQEEAEKYLAIFRRTLSGVPGKNLVDVVFSAQQVMKGEEHRLLMALRDTALAQEDYVQALYQRIIGSLEMEGHYVILLMYDAYDVPYRAKDGLKVEDASQEVFPYIVVSVCPVKQSKPALSYCAPDKEFHNRVEDWVVTAPELGFLFPAFDERSSNIYNALYYTRDLTQMHQELADAVFGTEMPMPAAAQKEAFQSILEQSLEEECSLEVVQAVHEQVMGMIEERKADKHAEQPVVSKGEVKLMLEACGVKEERVAAFTERFDQEFGQGMTVGAQNIVDPKKFEVKTADVVIHVNPARSDLVETRLIDGFKYVLIRAEEGVEVNGVTIHIQ